MSCPEVQHNNRNDTMPSQNSPDLTPEKYLNSSQMYVSVCLRLCLGLPLFVSVSLSQEVGNPSSTFFFSARFNPGQYIHGCPKRKLQGKQERGREGTPCDRQMLTTMYNRIRVVRQLYP